MHITVGIRGSIKVTELKINLSNNYRFYWHIKSGQKSKSNYSDTGSRSPVSTVKA